MVPSYAAIKRSITILLPLTDCLSKLKSEDGGGMDYTTKSFCLVHVFCRNMADFGLINDEYKKLFSHNPPAR